MREDTIDDRAMRGSDGPVGDRGHEGSQGKMEKEYIPPKQELLKRWTINIQFHDVGCTVQVGCKSVAFTDINEGLAALNEYIKNPYQSEKEWQKKFNQ